MSHPEAHAVRLSEGGGPPGSAAEAAAHAALPALDWMLDTLAALCAHDTTTGQEDCGLPALRALLQALGADVVVQPVAPGRSNVLARWGEPALLFSTHLDTVPPYVAPRGESDAFFGRGSADAKGQIVAQLAAVTALLARGETRVAWLGVVGEETDSVGARAALQLAPQLRGLRALVNGEPTGNRLATGQRGLLHLRLHCTGLAAHSSTPERGRSAVWPLLDWLGRLRDAEASGAADDDLGSESWNLGLLSGGEASNVVPAHAQAEVLARMLPGGTFLQAVHRAAPPPSEIESGVDVLLDSPPARFDTPPGFPAASMPFGSDAPQLAALVPSGRVLLAGPGRIEVAHAPDEHITHAEFVAGAALNLRLARHLLGALVPDGKA